MAKRKVKKIDSNIVVDMIHNRIGQVCIDREISHRDTQVLLEEIAKFVKADATHAAGVPNPSPKPPGGGTGG